MCVIPIELTFLLFLLIKNFSIVGNTCPKDDPIDTPWHCSCNILSIEKETFFVITSYIKLPWYWIILVPRMTPSLHHDIVHVMYYQMRKKLLYKKGVFLSRAPRVCRIFHFRFRFVFNIFLTNKMHGIFDFKT